MSRNLKKLTILHSNDMHGDFLAEHVDEQLMGGISMLSGYVTRVRANNPFSIYCIAGDMLQGSLIDAEYRGLSTIEIMNMLAPDIVSLGNHEIDYGVAHLLFLERCANFPIVCANLFIKNPYRRLFSPYQIMEINGMTILFIGVITQEVAANLRMDALLGSLVDVEEAALEVGRICNAHRSLDVDLTVLLTHIGHEEDRKLAALLDPIWGVDLIIGGHSHTILEEPEVVNDILIAQAGVGTAQIGHFDLIVDTDSNSIDSYQWRLVPITGEMCPRDLQLEETILNFKQTVDEKYDRVICRFRRSFTHPNRYQETELGNLISDALKDALALDLVLCASGSIRKQQVGPLFTYGDLCATFPFDEPIYVLKIKGSQLRHMLDNILYQEISEGGHGEFYQVSRGLRLSYHRESRTFDYLEYQGQHLADEEVMRVGLQLYHFKNFERFFDLPLKELVDGKGQIVCTSSMDVLEEYFSETKSVRGRVEGRIVIR